MTATTTNYAGRDVDLLIFQGLSTQKETRVEMALGNEVCSGIQKVAQTFAILFLTDKGSQPWDPTRGTNFMSSLRNNRIRDDNMLQAQFQFALLDIFDYLEGRTNDDTPDDEVLTGAELLSWDLRPTSLSIRVKLTTLAGTSRTYVIPAPIAV